MPAGANTANHEVASKPGSPCSAIVGISGADGERFAPVTPIARSLPSRTTGIAEGMLSNIIVICPPSRSGIANWRPLYGTCWVFTPARLLNSSPDTCTEVPMPGEPKVSCPGLAFASAISSCRVFAGTSLLTTSRFGVEAIRVTGAKSLTMS